jgi:hypothetical protein
VAFHFVSRFVKTPSVCGGIFMNQSGKKCFLRTLTMNYLRAIEYFSK